MITDHQLAQAILDMAETGLLETGSLEQLEEEFLSLTPPEDEEEFAPDTQMACDAATFSADLFQEATEALAEISPEQQELVVKAAKVVPDGEWTAGNLLPL